MNPVEARPIFLKSLAYELGEQTHDIDDLHDIPGNVRTLLTEAGLRSYRVSSRLPLDLARGPVADTLASLSDAERASIKRVIIATNSFHDPALTAQDGASRMLVELGLPDVTPVGVFLSFCANFHSAIEIARALVALDGEGSVLIICSDVLAADESRLVPPNISVFSDAAVSFVVSSTDGPYAILGTRLRVDSTLGLLDRTNQFVEYMDGVSHGVRGIVDDILVTVGRNASEVSHVLPNNYSRWVCRSMAELVGFSEDRLYLDNVARFAHAFAADNAINLCDFGKNEPTVTGEILALFGTGGFQWGCTLVEVV